jgi:hypothetical protein
MPETNPNPGGQAPTDQVVLDAARAEGARLERERVSQITALGANFKLERLAAVLIGRGTSATEAKEQFGVAVEIRNAGKPFERWGLTEEFVNSLVDEGVTLAVARERMQNKLVEIAGEKPIHGEVTITRDNQVTKLGCMQEALTLRCNPSFYLQKRLDPATGKYEFASDGGPERQRRAEEMGREYRGYILREMARESLELRGINTRGMDPMTLATRALIVRDGHVEVFGGGAESISDFPSILANVANKTLRQSYEAFPQTFKPFCRQVTAADFKPINRTMLSDTPALSLLNEKGEYTRLNLTDANTGYQLGTYGGIVALTRKTIINDDLQAFTRIPAILGVAAARKQSDIVWGIITSNPSAVYAGDTTSTALFHANHNNLLTTASSALALGTPAPATGLCAARAQLRVMKAPQGTPMNLTPRYMLVPAALESAGLQLIYPLQLAASAVTGVVPEWVQSLVPIVEPRLDANSTTAWYLAADPSQVDTIEYCFLEGQAGVYFESRQGFEVDGIEMKARMDFAAAAIDYRGLQKNAGA